MHCLVFEVKSIQAFIFASGRLRDAIGGSELIDLLTNEDKEQSENNLLDAVLVASQTQQQINFSRRAGGAFYAFSDDAAALDRFAALWSLALQHWAPGLGFIFGRGEGEHPHSAFDQARKDAQAQSSRERDLLPVVSPLAERSRRTGWAAVDWDKKDGAIDAAMLRSKSFADLSRAGFIMRNSPPEAQLNWRDWPRNLEPETEEEGGFPFAGAGRDIAVIHADGNGMGQVLIRISETVKHYPEKFFKIYQAFSKAVDDSTRHAAQQAVRDVLLPVRQQGELLAARPILLGGDDVIVLVRADLALAYVQAFARAFEEKSREKLKELSAQGVKDLPEKLTMGFGMAFIGANQPFSMAAELSVSIMEHAKQQAKKPGADSPMPPTSPASPAPSSVAFFRVTTALVDDYDTLVQRVMTHREGDQTYTHTLGAYAVLEESDSGLPKLADLERLVSLLQQQDMARGPVRGLLNLLQLDPAQARISWRRWNQRMRETQKTRLEEFSALMQALVPGYSANADLPYANSGCADAFISPLGDALDLLAIRHRSLSDIKDQEHQENAA